MQYIIIVIIIVIIINDVNTLYNNKQHLFNSPLFGTIRMSWYHKGKVSLDLLEQETLSGSGINWATCKSAPHPKQITMPALHHSVFLQAGCPSCYPTNRIKAQKTIMSILDFVQQSFCTTSLQIFFSLPLGLAPSTSYSIHFFTQSLSSFRSTFPYHHKLFCCSTEIMSSNPSLSLNPLLGTLILGSFTPHIHRSILVSVW